MTFIRYAQSRTIGKPNFESNIWEQQRQRAETGYPKSTKDTYA